MTIPNGWNAVGSPIPGPPETVYPPLPGAEPARAPDRPLEVCIVSNGILGPVRNGGISTLYMGLAEVLVEAGHDVTYLYTGERLHRVTPGRGMGRALPRAGNPSGAASPTESAGD